MGKINNFTVAKVTTALILFGLFCANSYMIFEQYIGKKMVTSSNVVVVETERQTLPAIVICRENAFTDGKKDMSKLDAFLNNTLSLILDVSDTENHPLEKNSTRLKRQYIYSFTRGLCHVVKYIPQVKPFDLLTLTFYANDGEENEDLLIWITHPGEEYFLHMSLWRDVPFTFKLEKQIASADITFKKVVKTEVESCNSSLEYDYIGCLKTSFRSRSKPGENHTVQDEPYTVPNCTAPWHQSLLDEQSYDASNSTVCDSDDRYSLYLLDYDFSQGGANMNEKKTGCMAPCTTVSYDVRALKFNQDPLHVWFYEPEGEDNNDTSNDYGNYEDNLDNGTSTTSKSDEASETSTVEKVEDISENLNQSTKAKYSDPRYIYLYYTTADETTLSSEVMIDFAGFISATGGNLGLFLGFSFMGMIFELFDWIEAKWRTSNKLKHRKASKVKSQN